MSGIRDVTRTHTVWTLVFKRAKQPVGIHRWLHEDFQHVLAMKHSAGRQFWIVVDPGHCATDVYLEPTAETPRARDAFPDATEILTVRAKYDQYVHNKHLSFITCVDVMKSVLGIKDTFCVTPYQLYKNLTGGKYERCNTTRQKRR